MSVQYTDRSPMPMGEYKGRALVNVPASTLLWYWDQTWFDKTSPLGRYIKDNMDVLKQQKRSREQLKR